jgi:hypothetical protein
VNFYKSAALAAIVLGSNSVTWVAHEGFLFPVKEISFMAIMSYHSNHRPRKNMVKCYQRRVYASKPDGYSFYRHYHLPMWFRIQSSEETLISE